MKTMFAAMLGSVLLFVALALNTSNALPGPERASASLWAIDTLSAEAANQVVQETCARCHNARRLQGGLDLTSLDVADATGHPEVAEKMIRKLRAGMMPPAGARRPEEATLTGLALALESRLDAEWATNPDPGYRTFQRLNQAEYAHAIHDLLGLEIDAADYLPLDTKSANFDNIADVQLLSPTLLDAYLNAAAEIARLAIGDPQATAASTTYTNPGYVSQWERVDGAPRGTRGGISVVHNFPADGDYVFALAFEHTTTGGFYGGVTEGEQIEVSIDGERVALLEVDRWMHVQDPNGVNMETGPVSVSAGPHRVSAAFIAQAEGPVEDLLSPHDWSLVDRQVGVSGFGITALAHLKDLVIQGPENPTGVSETPSRARIFTCRPESEDTARSCAEEIIGRLGAQAFRRPLTDTDRDALMGLYDGAAAQGGFEIGMRTALQGILASPDFVFRLEEVPADVRPGDVYRISDVDLASRLSFFLWGTVPDQQLIELAEQGALSERDVLEAQVTRMLDDPRAEALATRFAAQWLRLDDLEKVHPDRLLYPDFHQQLSDAMRRETELFFHGLVEQDRSVLELLTADYTYLNERLARHYGIAGVTGHEFRRVSYPDDSRRGLLGHGSVLTLTSHANRTSPVLRGKWVMEVLLGSPPPPPPPNVPALEETGDTEEGRMLSVREMLAKHRANPTCNSCHRMMDPIGLALENYDVTGAWRIKDNGVPVDAAGELYDGTEMTGVADLREGLLRRSDVFVLNFIENLMAYGLGRRVEYSDMPAVRAIARQAEANDYRMSSFVMGVATSAAFQMNRAAVTVEDSPDGS